MACTCEQGLSAARRAECMYGLVARRMGTRFAFPREKHFLPASNKATQLCRPGAGSNINDVLVGWAITLTGSLSADSKGDKIPFVFCSPACGITTIFLVETVYMDGASNWVDFDSLVRNSRQRLQIAGNNKIMAINRLKQARYKTKIQVNVLKKNWLMRSRWNKHRSECIK